MLQRLGLQELHVRKARSNVSPSLANRCKFGVRICGCPIGEQSSVAISSAMMTMKLGRFASAAVEVAAPMISNKQPRRKELFGWYIGSVVLVNGEELVGVHDRRGYRPQSVKQRGRGLGIEKRQQPFHLVLFNRTSVNDQVQSLDDVLITTKCIR